MMVKCKIGGNIVLTEVEKEHASELMGKPLLDSPDGKIIGEITSVKVVDGILIFEADIDDKGIFSVKHDLPVSISAVPYPDIELNKRPLLDGNFKKIKKKEAVNDG